MRKINHDLCILFIFQGKTETTPCFSRVQGMLGYTKTKIQKSQETTDYISWELPSKESKKEGKDQESTQSSTTPDPGYQWETLSQPMTTRHQQTDVHKSITKQDKNNMNDPQK